MRESYKKNLQHAKELRHNSTPEENKLWYQFLSHYSPRFRRQFPIDNYILDFYCTKIKLAIELDGGGHYENNQMAYDQKRTNKLKEQGIDVVRYTNLDIKNNFEGVCMDIDRIVKLRMNNY